MPTPNINNNFDNDQSNILFHPPENGIVVERFILYRLRFDGIALTKYGKIGNTYYQLGLEIININEADREKFVMTCHGMLFSKEDIDFVSDYLHRVLVLGINGIWIKKVEEGQTKWYHWRWAIMSIPCDTVAQEELIGELNKKFTNDYCLYCDGEKSRFNPFYFQLQSFKYKTKIENKTRFTVINQPLNTLNPASCLRFPSLIYHACNSKNLEEFLRRKGFNLSKEQKEDIKALNLFFDLFGDLFHQYLPTSLNPDDLTAFWDETFARFQIDAECIHEKEDDRQSSNKQNFLKNNILIPEKEALTLDGMHNISNICNCFISIINNNGKASIDKKFNQYIKNMLGIKTKEWSLDPSFKKILPKANERVQTLYSMKLVDNGLFEESKLKGATSHNRILSFCTFFSYIFQDSLHIPILFLFKVILDYLVEFFNVNYDIKSLVEKQSIFNIMLGLLQNEIAPFYLKISVYNAIHYMETILNSGDIASSNCFLSEHFYSFTRKNVYACKCPITNASSRLMMMIFAYHASLEEEEETICMSVFDNIPEMIELQVKYYSTPFNIRKETLLQIIKCNLYDEISFYKDSSYSRNTFLDMLLMENISLDNTNIQQMANEYLGNHLVNVDISQMTNIYDESQKSFDIPHFKLGNSMFTKNLELFNKRIAFTRLHNGNIQLFYIIGFITFKVNHCNFTNLLCLPIPSSSAASYVYTTTYGFVDLESFRTSWEKSSLFLVSTHRVIMGTTRVLKYQEGYQYVTNKLIIRQYRPIKNSKLLNTILEFI